jgi:hypothetical protein
MPKAGARLTEPTLPTNYASEFLGLITLPQLTLLLHHARVVLREIRWKLSVVQSTRNSCVVSKAYNDAISGSNPVRPAINQAIDITK